MYMPLRINQLQYLYMSSFERIAFVCISVISLSVSISCRIGMTTG